MIAMLHRGGFTRQQFDDRFCVSTRTFRRELATLREAGFYIAAPTSTGTDRRYTMTAFFSDREAA